MGVLWQKNSLLFKVILVFFIIGFILVSLWTIEGFFRCVIDVIISSLHIDFIDSSVLEYSFLKFGYLFVLVSFFIALFVKLFYKIKIYGFWIIIIGGLLMIVVLPFIVFLGFLGYI